ncbi:MAG TPA: helix-turn-helix domain-containing protein [Bacteroidales bacterium]|nr:helix-turn-helix domain-containing protein [Bacteroidales bacterium]
MGQLISPYIFPLLNCNADMTSGSIISRVCRHYHITEDEIKQKTRRREIVEPRSVAMYKLRKLGLSWASVGKAFGKDHATAMWACRQVENFLQIDRDFRERTRGLLS